MCADKIQEHTVERSLTLTAAYISRKHYEHLSSSRNRRSSSASGTGGPPASAPRSGQHVTSQQRALRGT
eukprot:1585619-Rhodomonas_salina.1